MTRYQDIYDGMEAGKEILKAAKQKMRFDRLVELQIEIEAVELAMDHEYFRARWQQLKTICERLNKERVKLLKED